MQLIGSASTDGRSPRTARQSALPSNARVRLPSSTPPIARPHTRFATDQSAPPIGVALRSVVLRYLIIQNSDDGVFTTFPARPLTRCLGRYQWAAQCVADKNLFYRYASLSYTMGCGRRGRGWGLCSTGQARSALPRGSPRRAGCSRRAFVLFDRDGIRAAACGGLASLEHGIPFTPDTPSRYASISKHFWRRRCCWKISRWMRRWGVAARLASRPGVSDPRPSPGHDWRLRHDGGAVAAGFAIYRHDIARRNQLRAGTIGPTCSAPGAEMAYSNTGWRLGQAVLADAASSTSRRCVGGCLIAGSVHSVSL